MNINLKHIWLHLCYIYVRRDHMSTSNDKDYLRYCILYQNQPERNDTKECRNFLKINVQFLIEHEEDGPNNLK